ncbi:MAG: hypothetical protein PHX34_01195 [Candidatus Shapirobacteria bacterium]|nr:hypothetical protein [Candidatus Shapirobacteria bacterium]
MSNNKKSWPFWVIMFIALVSIFCVGLFLVAPDSQVISNTITETGDHLLKVLIKIVMVIIFTLALGSLYFRFILGIPFSSLKEKLKESHNDSHTIIISGIAISLAIAFLMAGGINLRQYLYQICTKGIIGYLVAIIITLIMTRMAGVKSVGEFRDLVNTPSNDSHAILISSILTASLLISMS